MKTQVEDISQVKKKLLIEIEAEEIDTRINKAFKALGKKAKINGFRPGKIPIKILERYYGEQLLGDVTSSIIRETLPKAVEEAQIYPLNIPVVENEILKKGQKYKYTALMEVRPEFELKNYLGAEVEKEKCVVKDDDVEKQITDIREAHGNLKSITEERSIKEGDYAIIDYEAFDGDLPLEDEKSQNYPLKIGGDRFYPGFDKALIGSKKGDKPEIKIDFEDEYFNSRLAGKSILFRVNITDIKEMDLPELNDEFVKGLGAEFETLEQLKDKIRETLKVQEEKRIDNQVKDCLLEKIADNIEFELPEGLVQSEVNASLENIRQNLIRAGSNMEKSGLDEAKIREEIKPSAEKNVKCALILGEIARQNNLDIDDEDLSEGFKEIAGNSGSDPDTIKKYYEANNLIDAFRQTLLKEKTLNYLVENANVVDVKSK